MHPNYDKIMTMLYISHNSQFLIVNVCDVFYSY
jgi:hypothetical protein